MGHEKTSLESFYSTIGQLKRLNSRIFNLILKKEKIPKRDISSLRKIYSALNSIPKKKGKFTLYHKGIEIQTKLGYELGELKKDLIYLEKGEKSLINYLSSLHKDFSGQKQAVVKALKAKDFDLFVSDRDGTINNYSERYLSSVQSIYNAVFVSRFVSHRAKNSIILTSASLGDFNKVNIIPKVFSEKNNLVLGGSKGSEFFLKKRAEMPLSKNEGSKLRLLEKGIKSILSEKRYRKLVFIGSGFQRKHGQLAVARQDIFNSIDKKISREFLEKVASLVNKMNHPKAYFTMNDTGTDIEITLRMDNKTFNKGVGVDFILKHLGLKAGNCLVCGDTGSDLSFFDHMKKRNKGFNAVFVTTDPRLKAKARAISKETVFVSSPDILVTALNELSRQDET